MKFLSKLMATTAVGLCMTLVSCGGASLKAIDEKIEQQGIEASFSSGEYDAMIGFLEKLFKNSPKYDSSDENQIEQFGDDFGRMFNYMMALGLAKDNGKLSSSQIEKFNNVLILSKEYENIYSDDTSEGKQKVIVDLNGNIVGDYVRETSTTYIGLGQDEFEVSKSNHNVVELNNENGEGVVFCKDPGDVVIVYKEPSLDAPIIGNMIYEEGYLPQTYECLGKNGNWYKIRFNHQTGYVEVNSVEWDAEDYF